MTQKLLQITLLATLLAVSLSVGLRQQQDQQPQSQDEVSNTAIVDIINATEAAETANDTNNTDVSNANSTNDTYKPYICPYNDPALTLCAAYVANSCVCYANGTCAEVETNSCNGCFDDDVVSVTEGEQCPAGNVSGRYVRCQTSQPDAEICAAYLIQGCICYSNGTCQAGEVNACSDCRDNDTLLVIEGGDCPANGIANGVVSSGNGPSTGNGEEEEEQSEDLEDDESFKPNVCPDYTGIFVNCIQIARNSCVCYTNGTCANVETNACIYCQQADVVSVNEGEQCPSQNYNGTLTACKAQPEDTVCTLQITDGCACYRNGTCIAGQVNACSDCSRNNETVLVIENGACPENGIEARD